MGQAKVDRRRSGSSDKKRPSRGMLKKKAAHNSLGKTKMKKGSAAKYMTRARALRTLQVSLKDFRRLCILKGIYPRDPPKKFQGSDKTYYYSKDILYLQHEPLLNKFREMSALIKKVVKRAGRGEKADAVRLYDARPVYRLDHLIRERYPSFTDALRDLDDALCLVHLFACVPTVKLLPPERVANCARLCREFQAMVAHTHCLRKVFASIKGIYFEAEVHGVPLLWLVPHSLKQEIPDDVDIKVLLTFLEFYEVLLQFVNYKLFTMRRLAYPPLRADETPDPMAEPGLERMLRPLAGAGAGAGALLAGGGGGGGAVHAANLRRSNSPYEAPNREAMARFRRKLRAVEADTLAAAEAAEGAQEEAAALEEAALEAVEAQMANAEAGGADTGADGADGVARLFDGLTFFLGRETPMAALELVIKSFGGAVVWDGYGGRLTAASAEITHEIVDRPALRAPAVEARVYAQPQWVLDCANAGQLLPAHAYAVGCKPPPHLSPFADGSEGYVPPEREAHPAFGPAKPLGGGASDDDVDDVDGESDEEPADSDDDGGDDSEAESAEVDEAAGESEDEEERFARELEAERRGVAPKKGKGAKGAKRAPADEHSAAERKELQKMMMAKKDARLYKQMQFGIARKQAAADKLSEKRARLESPAAKPKGKRPRT